MIFQGQPITTPQHDAPGEQFSLLALLGLSKPREKELRKAIKKHHKNCITPEGHFSGVDYLSTCPIDCQTPQELAYVAMKMEGVMQAQAHEQQSLPAKIVFKLG
ncbi:hypothetical protein [Hymenobacter lapidiphilus]|uniref:Uncharacterized protein n=1 Tax=Hymenobacter lapidiphilus TaxID=2608003 RepID=A0A7Y7PT11_9BACT|nr:hypothetical protein [Hymenobacter lapidiphilus]NVO33505.1 hypothetical protein [Hymenobacter lapidiphilus]